MRHTRTLTPTFMSEMRAKGFCYFCDEPYIVGHSLTYKKIQIHVMELQETPSDRELSNKEGQFEPLYSSLMEANFRTMRVTGYVNKQPL